LTFEKFKGPGDQQLAVAIEM